MPGKQKSAHRSASHPVVITGALFSLALTAFWFWPASPVELDKLGYEFTISLYRACNQKDLDAISTLEAKLDEPEVTQQLSGESEDMIRDVLADARAGKWHEAMQACRVAMEDQVQY